MLVSDVEQLSELEQVPEDVMQFRIGVKLGRAFYHPPELSSVEISLEPLDIDHHLSCDDSPGMQVPPE